MSRPPIHQDLIVEVGEYDKNRRYDVPKGTKFVQVTRRFPYNANSEREGKEALNLAWMEARLKFGDFDREQVEYFVAYFSCQVLVEFRVRPA